MNQVDFSARFAHLTGHQPLNWQWRLYQEWMKGHVRPVIDLPTGLGKTMVMAIWLIARSNHPDKLPTRLIYVVDRRTVVDQSTDLAQRLRSNFGTDKLAISTLRGQLADNREWSVDPSRLAIIIGTVDLIGSALLFSGYRSSFKRRPLEAGLLGQDALLVLDEAHLSRPFQKLVTSIASFQTTNDQQMRVVRMSATSEVSTGEAPFKLESSDLKDQTISQRFNATKRLKLPEPVEEKDLNRALASAALELAHDTKRRGKRIVVFVRKPEDALWIAEAIRKHGARMSMAGMHEKSVEVLTGTMRGLERDELVATPVVRRFMDGSENLDLEENRKPIFLISTSAGEVGFDLNADHLVCDAAPLDSWIQRLGRVNRRGTGDATVILVRANAPADKTGFEAACLAASDLLTDDMDVSPKGLAEFKQRLTLAENEKASSPKATTVDLTDLLLDAWSMTSIIDPMPGRPAVGPWLRGIDTELPQTTLAWRQELDLPGFAALDAETIEEWFDTHRILTHETLSVPSSVAVKWFLARWNELPDDLKANLADKPIIIDRAGLTRVTVKELIDQLSRKVGDATAAIRNADLILPASFGGIERGDGMLDASAPRIPDDERSKPIDEQRQAQTARLTAPDVADVAPGRPRLRVVESSIDGVPQDSRVLGNGQKPTRSVVFRIELESDDDRTVRVSSYVPRREKPELGSGEPETLSSHVGKVRNTVDAILSRISTSADIRRAAQLAADFHDHGKARERWQRLLVFQKDYVKPTEPMGKSGGEMKRDPRGYRHEFGSLRELTDAVNAGTCLDQAGNKIDQDVFELALHMIATHHGRGRPHFARGGFDPDCEERTDDIHTDAIRRFARLQRKYGWWRLAWLENLLRCADAMASAPTTNPTEISEDGREAGA